MNMLFEEAQALLYDSGSARPYAVTSLFLSVLILLVFLSIAALRPPHLRLDPFGKRWIMPPGPQGLPVVGNLLSWLRAKRNASSLIAWLSDQSQYGEMTTLHMGSKTWVLLNSSRVVDEIFAKRAAVTNERPYFPVAGGLISRNRRVFLQHSKEWKPSRNLMQVLLNGSGAKEHGRIVESESLHLLRAYLEEPQDWYFHNYRFALAVIHQILTGAPLQKSRTDLEELQSITSAFLTSINASYVDFFPLLAKLPKCLQTWRAHWEAMGLHHYQIFSSWWQGLQPLMEASAPPSFLRDRILKAHSGNEEQAIYLTMFILAAGADNPRMTFNAWIMSTISAPAEIQKARDELDKVCGSQAERLPTLGDLESMPLLCAVVKEVLRWRPTVPLIPQHVSVEDLAFEAYRFPAGTEFLANSMSVCRHGYSDQEAFRPDRWLDPLSPGSGVAQDAWPFAFSQGRRMCVGPKLAQKELFIVFARLLYCFNFTPAGDFDDTILNAFSIGEPFPVRVTARSRAHESLIHTEFENLSRGTK